MDSSLGLHIFTALFLSGTFLAALVAGLGGFAFGIIAAAVWLYILTPLQTATLIIGLGLVVQGYSVWKLRHAFDWRKLAPLIIGAALGVPIGISILDHTDPRYLRRGVAVVLVVFSLYGLLRPAITPIKSGALAGDVGTGFLNGACSEVRQALLASSQSSGVNCAAGPRISSAPYFGLLGSPLSR
jgi:uncharacterized membrane protein YfcA